MTEPVVVDRESNRPGGWLHERRWRIALWIAVVEAIIVAIAHDVSRWTVLVLAAIAFAIYYWVGRRSRSGAVHDLTWIFGASQALALMAAILALFISFLAFIVAAIFAVVALAYFLFDRR
jgi:hypothetical protein